MYEIIPIKQNIYIKDIKKIKIFCNFVQILFCVRYEQVTFSFGAEKYVRYVQCPLRSCPLCTGCFIKV